ncbi:ABC transporter ATP-binding protein [Mumia zhuanghuii]|uniref:ABC transporter ATP-binding protein n=2 Tax=Mumia TaxID=1546255 RepID=A0ABW1QSI2_9ACTN|nr:MULTISPECIES: ABC transporter ATP-binding protein [Mumia]KAA1424488.1 ABC transporter ATP-binding protein [Mumia zhuanghuii]
MTVTETADRPPRPAPEQAAISLRGLRKEFGDVVAVDGVDLDIEHGEFFSMLGPSGSGKTTVLRLIAGFERADVGTVTLGGTDVTTRAPFERDVNTVFQDYALFPHMNVLDNVAYGLRVRGVRKAQRRARALEALGTVQLGHLADRRPNQLSGGQRQRVALARAIVVEPSVLLLDEPLGALDLKLREQMQVELKALQRNLGITFVFVTHDQEEALTLSDRVAVFRDGRIVQLGTPQEVYEEPRDPYVASFVGTSNLFDSAVSQQILGRAGIHALRPEKVTLTDAAATRTDEPVRVTDGVVEALGVVAETIYLGAAHRVIVDLEAGPRLVVLEQTAGALAAPEHRGDVVWARWALDDVVPLSAEADQ